MNWSSFCIEFIKGGRNMIINIHEISSATFDQVCEKEIAKPSTYKERVFADRIVMLAMLIGTIIMAVAIS